MTNEDSPMIQIGIIIRVKRRALNLTIEQLAEKADVSESLVSQMERGVNKNISLKKLDQILTALNLKMSTIFTESADNGIHYLELINYLATFPTDKRDELAEKILSLLSFMDRT
ncbi:helix-turn-helix domain-containing protein [Companilactobacillus kedongensis]|uniref:helix-turn-helix domain-containing protein n=1 Tax=Companilactobacillus kedongensis TaxID=2486004 RepID=UPI001CDC219A|nr:helix-turn-helix transcriptional regulator [Companilactobacillus kedongensis]